MKLDMFFFIMKLLNIRKVRAMSLSNLQPMHYIALGLAVALLLFIVLFIYALSSKKKAIRAKEEALNKERSEMKSNYEESSEKSRLTFKKELAEQKDTYEAQLSTQNAQIDSLKLFSRDKGEYLTDLTLINLKDNLVAQERIRPEDMHVLANIYIPGKRVKSTDKLDHVILTRTGIYVIDSNYWTGYLYHGISEMQFDGEPIFETVFNILELDSKSEQTICLDKGEDGSAQFRSYKHSIEELKLKAERLEKVFELPYPVTPIAYYNAEGVGSEHITNYSRDNSVKVIVGEKELEHFFEKFVFHGRFQYKVEELEEVRAAIEHLNP